MADLAEALRVINTVTRVDLRSKRIGDAGAIALAEALKVNETVTRVDLQKNEIGDAGASALAEALKVNQKISHVYLRSNEIGDDGACAIAEALEVNKTVTNVGLDLNNVGDVGAWALAEAFKVNQTITEFDLRYNSIGDDGASALAEALKVNQTITQVDLRYNGIGDVGASALAEALAVSKTLTKVQLENNVRIGDAGACALAEALALGKAPIVHLGLYPYPSGPCGLEIEEVIRRNEAATRKLAGDLIEWYEYEMAGKKYEFDVFKTRGQDEQDSREQEAPKPDISVKVFKRFQAADKDWLMTYVEDITGRVDSYASELFQYTKEYINENYLKLIGVSKAPFGDLPEAIVQKILHCVASSGDAHSLFNGDLTPAAAAAGEDGGVAAAPISRQHDDSRANEAPETRHEK